MVSQKTEQDTETKEKRTGKNIRKTLKNTKKETPIKETEQQAEETKEKPPLTFKEFYPVNDIAYGYVGIQIDKETGKLQYLTVEPTMTDEEKQILARLKTILKEEGARADA